LTRAGKQLNEPSTQEETSRYISYHIRRKSIQKVASSSSDSSETESSKVSSESDEQSPVHSEKESLSEDEKNIKRDELKRLIKKLVQSSNESGSDSSDKMKNQFFTISSFEFVLLKSILN